MATLKFTMDFAALPIANANSIRPAYFMKTSKKRGVIFIYKIKNYLLGFVLAVRKKLKKKWNRYKNKWLLIPLAVIFLYISGIIAQIASNRATWVPGELAIFPSLNPFKVLFSLFSSYGVKSMVGVFLITLIGYLLFTLYKEDRTGQTYDKKRKVWYSDKGTHGTAHWMTEAEQREFFSLTPLEAIGSVEDVIYGITEHGEVISRRQDTQINRHIAVFGASGTQKSRAFVRTQIIVSAKRNESMILTDPKAELASDTVEYLKSRGYDVKILNMVKPKDSHRYDALYGAKEDPTLVNKIVDAVIANTGGSTGTNYHDYAEANLLNALIFYELEFPTNGKHPTLGGAYNTLLGCDDFDQLKAKIYACGRTSRAAKAYSLFHNSSDNLKGNVINGLGSRLQILQNPDVEELIGYPDINFKKLRTEKCAYFLIISDQDASMRFISSLFFNLMFIHLVELADFSEDIALRPVNLIMDEAMNVGVINEFASRISTIRSRLVNVFVIFQDISQIENRYPGTWLSIIGNCDVQIFLGCTDPVTAKFVSERSGEGSITVKNKMRSRNLLFPVEPMNYREAQSLAKRKLLTENEVLTMDNQNMYIMMRGGQIYEAEKFDYSRHPESKFFYPINIQGVMRKETEQRAVVVTSEKGESYRVNRATGEAIPDKNKLQHQKTEAIPQAFDSSGKPIRAKRSSKQLEGQINLFASGESDRNRKNTVGRGVVHDITQERMETLGHEVTETVSAAVAETVKPNL